MTMPLPPTPCVMIDLDRVDDNINTMQLYCDKHNIRLRPHIKTHKLPSLALQQLAVGAKGITCQKISEAEIFADAGCTDILITYNIIGEEKLQRLRDLSEQISLSVVADNSVVIEGLIKTMKGCATPMHVMVECDTGAGRCGVQNAEEALVLAQQIDKCAELHFEGLMTYPANDNLEETQNWLTSAKQLLKENGIECNTISSGGTPNRNQAHQAPIVDEYRVGTYVYCDRSLLASNRCTEDEIALTLHTTVVSCPTESRAVIDSGSKALTSDLLGLDSYGLVLEYPEARITQLSEEHGVIDLSACTKKPKVGERLRIVPNHACPVSNLFDNVWTFRSGEEPRAVQVAARGCVL